MLKRLIILSFIIFVVVSMFGCAATGSRGTSLLKQQRYDDAIGEFLLELKKNRNNRDAWRDLGIAYLKKGETEKAEKALLQAYQLDNNDGKTIFYLGAAYEAQGDYTNAIQYYRQYTKVGRLSKMRGQIEGRLELLSRKQMEMQAQQAVANENYINVASIPDNSVAVLYFQNLGTSTQLDPLQKGLADMIITDLSQVHDLKVVERVRMQKMLEEIGLGQTGLVDESTAPRMGKLLGAKRMVKGTFVDLNEQQIRIDGGMIETTTGKFMKTDQSSGDLERFFRLEKNLVFSIINEMGIQLTDAERKAIQYIPTESMLAFLAYSKGLDAEDRGDFEVAREQYSEAVKLDPGFSAAGERMNQAESMEMGTSDIEQVETSLDTQPTTVEYDTRTRLESSMSNIDSGFIPSIDSREPVQEQTKTIGFGGGVEVEIEVPIPR